MIFGYRQQQLEFESSPERRLFFRGDVSPQALATFGLQMPVTIELAPFPAPNSLLDDKAFRINQSIDPIGTRTPSYEMA